MNHEELEFLKEQEETEEAAQREANGGSCPGPMDILASTVDRRGFLKVGMGGMLSLMLAQWLDPATAANAQGVSLPKSGTAKACILLWMNGGPSHMDTFDPKPGTMNGGQTKSVKTNVAGIEISEHLPQVAEVANHLAIIRGMTSKEGNHQRAQYLLHTGYSPNPTVAHPSLGAYVNEEMGAKNSDLPNFVSISGPSIGAGFLGVQYAPFVLNDPQTMPSNVAFSRNMNQDRFGSRLGALEMMEQQFSAETGDPKVGGRQAVYGKAVKMMQSPRLKAFDIGEEPQAIKDAYGDSNFGRGCLMARRLIESGVKFVEVVQDGWDMHKDVFGGAAKLGKNIDPAMATLIKELEDRKLLDSTLIVWMGEFGRTPKINANEGRDHYPKAWNAVLAGGGVRKGIVYGQTDPDGATVVDKPVQVPDLFATISTLLGMSPSKSFMTPVGRPITITEKGTPVRDLIA